MALFPSAGHAKGTFSFVDYTQPLFDDNFVEALRGNSKSSRSADSGYATAGSSEKDLRELQAVTRMDWRWENSPSALQDLANDTDTVPLAARISMKVQGEEILNAGVETSDLQQVSRSKVELDDVTLEFPDFLRAISPSALCQNGGQALEKRKEQSATAAVSTNESKVVKDSPIMPDAMQMSGDALETPGLFQELERPVRIIDRKRARFIWWIFVQIAVADLEKRLNKLAYAVARLHETNTRVSDEKIHEDDSIRLSRAGLEHPNIDAPQHLPILKSPTVDSNEPNFITYSLIQYITGSNPIHEQSSSHSTNTPDANQVTGAKRSLAKPSEHDRSWLPPGNNSSDDDDNSGEEKREQGHKRPKKGISQEGRFPCPVHIVEPEICGDETHHVYISGVQRHLHQHNLHVCSKCFATFPTRKSYNKHSCSKICTKSHCRRTQFGLDGLPCLCITKAEQQWIMLFHCKYPDRPRPALFANVSMPDEPSQTFLFGENDLFGNSGGFGVGSNNNFPWSSSPGAYPQQEETTQDWVQRLLGVDTTLPPPQPPNVGTPGPSNISPTNIFALLAEMQTRISSLEAELRRRPPREESYISTMQLILGALERSGSDEYPHWRSIVHDQILRRD